jgi:hypothetical protein
MKLLTSLLLGLFLITALASAASIDGKWVSERKMERDGNTMVIVQTFELKSDGGKLTGKLTMQFGDMEPRTADIKDGKVDGDKFSFSVTMEGPMGQTTTAYKGAVEGDALKGTALRDGGQERPFEAKKK